MEDNPGFAYAYGWNIHYQKILGICARDNEGVLAKRRAWTWPVIVFLSVWLPQAASLPVHWGDMNPFIICLSTNFPIAISILKIIVLQRKRKAIGWMLTTIANDWLKVGRKKEREIMLKSAETSRTISILSFSITNIMFVEFILSQLWKLLRQGVDMNRDSRLAPGLLHDSYYPFDTTAYSIFVPLWFFQFFGTFVASISYAGPDCFVSAVVLHLCSQLSIIRHSLEHLVDEITANNPEEYWKRIANIVKRHEQLNHLAFVIGRTFTSILLVQMLACTMTFCLQGYVLFTTLLYRNGAPLPLLDLGFSFIYSVYTVVHLFIYCYIGDRLLIESSSLADDFYKTKWYILAPREAKAFLLVCLRSRIPLEIKAGKFFIFTLQLFNAIMKNSMGYLSMLIAMKDKLIE